MNYYVREIPYESQMRGAWGKARGDINAILDLMDFKPIEIKQANREVTRRINRNFEYGPVWENALSVLRQGDNVVIQYPPLENTIFLPRCLKKLSKRGIKIILIIHDLVTLVDADTLKKFVYSLTEPRALDSAAKVIVHNEYMAKKINNKYGVTADKLVTLGIFDYLLPERAEEEDNTKIRKEFPIIIAGNLSPYKTQYLYHLPEECEYNLYGIGFMDEGRPNVHYHGSFPPEELPDIMTGSFGLVWDGDAADNCSGVLGEYLKINNPHKTSLYLACGIPVIIWEEAAMADFIMRENCGFTVSSLNEIASSIERMTHSEYTAMRENAERIGARLRRGDYLKAAIEKCIN